MRLSFLLLTVILLSSGVLPAHGGELVGPDPDRLGSSVSGGAAAVPSTAPAKFVVPKGLGVAYGLVTDGIGKPVTGAGIIVGSESSLETSQAFVKFIAQTDARGRFEIRLNPPASAEELKDRKFLLIVAENRVALRVPLSGLTYTTNKSWQTAKNQIEARLVRGFDVLARLWGRKTARKRPGTNLKTLVLQRGVRIRGHVVDADGKAVAGVRVVAEDLLAHSRYGGLAKKRGYYSYGKTGKDGMFNLPGVFETGSWISLSKPGFFAMTKPVVGNEKTHQFSLRHSAKVVGTVLGHDGSPAQGAIQVAYEVSGKLYSEKVKKDGTFQFELKHPHRYRVIVNPHGDSSKHYTKSYSPVLSGGQDSLVIKLDPKVVKPKNKVVPKSVGKPNKNLGFPITVVDKATGLPLKKFKAGTIWVRTAYADNERYMTKRGLPKTKSNTQPGYIRVQPPTSPLQFSGGVVVSATGYANHVTKVAWDPDRKPRLRIEMIPESVVSGAVRDLKTGDPISGVTVRSYAFSKNRASSELTTIRSDKDGRYRLAGLQAGHYQLKVTHKNRLGRAQSVDLRAGEKRSDVDFLLPVNATVRGLVRGIPAGKRWNVELITESQMRTLAYNPSYRFSGIKSVSGTAGRFEFKEIKAGFYEVCLRIPQDDRKGSSLRIPIEPIRVRDQDLDLEIDASGDFPGAIQGQVTVDGVEIDPARLLVLASTPKSPNTWNFGYPSALTLTGSWSQVAADGTYRVDLAAGRYDLFVLDVLTGVYFFQSSISIDVSPGKTRTNHVKLELAEVRVKISPKEKGASTAASWLDIDVAPLKSSAILQVFVNTLTNQKPSGVALERHQGVLSLILPLHRTALRVRSNASKLARTKEKILPVIGTVVVTPELGKVTEIEIQVQVPSEGLDPERPASSAKKPEPLKAGSKGK